MYSQMQKENKIMIILVMLLLKTVEVEEEVSVISISRAIFQIFLKIFLVKVLVVEEGLENQIIEVLT